MAPRGLVLYLLSGFSMAILSVLFVSHPNYNNSYQNGLTSTNLALPHSLYGSITKTVWPELEFSWRIVLATVIGFLGSACGTVGGVGGGGIFVPMLTLIVGFDTKSAAALSKCMIMGASASSVWYNLRVLHPTKEVPIIDYDLALLFQPMLMLGITIGVALSVVFPYWLITVLIIILFLGTSSRSFFKGIEMWKEETVLKKEIANRRETVVNSRGELLIDTQYESLVPREDKAQMQILCLNLRWKRILVLLLVWVSFLALQIVKNDVEVCSAWYWVLFCVQFPIALGVFGYEAVKLYREHKKRKRTGNAESICEASIEWTVTHIAFCSLCGILGGTVGGLLGSGGGFILGPLLLEIGVIPQVASATATFVMTFSSSLSVVEFYLLKRFPIPYALYLTSVSVLAGFWGQFFIRKLITILRRASVIIFILSGVIFLSALTMGIIGIETSIEMIRNHEFMGFLGFCSSQ
ncbi:sulfite exporter TauE/SafE family protein 4-like [Juglans microcarpa x Juglans regia]|uniref:sulfite exporter TauE/SafE family protein 4-like n=1 Tax=Juglans microcarpa x Juglans regia TaxID=2249226 RepID=UPI001B7F5B8B|nr:sulfite exporter TauE/SafE family protein 4-like [Juglans microcarpa x Juglans regia]